MFTSRKSLPTLQLNPYDPLSSRSRFSLSRAFSRACYTVTMTTHLWSWGSPRLRGPVWAGGSSCAAAPLGRWRPSWGPGSSCWCTSPCPSARRPAFCLPPAPAPPHKGRPCQRGRNNNNGELLTKKISWLILHKKTASGVLSFTGVPAPLWIDLQFSFIASNSMCFNLDIEGDSGVAVWCSSSSQKVWGMIRSTFMHTIGLVLS